MPILAPPVGPLVAARAYLLAQLAERQNPLPVGVQPPPGTPTSYALLSRPGGSERSMFTGDYLIRVRVFDKDVEQCEHNADLLHRLLMAARHRKIATEKGDVWITGTQHQDGPSSLDDPDIPLPGMQCAVFWTIGLKLA